MIQIKHLLLLLVLVFRMEGYCQDSIYSEKQPSFPGGEKQLYCFIDQNLNKDILKSVDTIGVIYISFIIDTIGNPNEFKIKRSLNPILDNEFLRVLKIMPKWSPGMQLNKHVPVLYNFPLRIPYKNEFCK